MHQRRGVTWLEVLVVLAICFFAVGLAVVVLARHRENSVRIHCINNLRRIGTAFHSYHTASSADEARRVLPPSRIDAGFATWGVLLAPYLGDKDALQAWDLQQSYFAQPAETREARLIVYFCPARRRSGALSLAGDVDTNGVHFSGGLGDYASVAGDGSVDGIGPKANGALIDAEVIERKDDRILQWMSRTGLSSLTRGESYTLLIGEKHVPAGHEGDAAFGDGSLYNGQKPASYSRITGPGFPLASAIDSPFNNNFGSYHDGVCNFLMADGSVRSMTLSVSEDVLGQLARRKE